MASWRSRLDYLINQAYYYSQSETSLTTSFYIPTPYCPALALHPVYTHTLDDLHTPKFVSNYAHRGV